MLFANKKGSAINNREYTLFRLAEVIALLTLVGMIGRG